MTAATFDQVEKRYSAGIFNRQPITALKKLDLSIPQGSVFGLLGPNRAGKTTLVKLLLSLTRASKGQMTRLGRDLADRRSLARIGYMHENHAFPRYLSAREVLYFYGGLSEVPAEILSARVDEMLAKVGLQDRDREPISQFSKGMVQRLGLAQALINSPDLLILDEPTEGLDLAGRTLIRDVVRELHAAGKTVLLVSHVLTEIEALCDELAILVAGSLVFRGSMKLLRQKHGPDQSFETLVKQYYDQGEAW